MELAILCLDLMHHIHMLVRQTLLNGQTGLLTHVNTRTSGHRCETVMWLAHSDWWMWSDWTLIRVLRLYNIMFSDQSEAACNYVLVLTCFCGLSDVRHSQTSPSKFQWSTWFISLLTSVFDLQMRDLNNLKYLYDHVFLFFTPSQLFGNIWLSMASLVIFMQLRYLFHEVQRRIRRHKNYLRVIDNMESRWAA